MQYATSRLILVLCVWGGGQRDRQFCPPVVHEKKSAAESRREKLTYESSGLAAGTESGSGVLAPNQLEIEAERQLEGS